MEGMLNVGQIIKNMDIDLNTIIYFTFSVLFAIKMVLGEIAVINAYPKRGRITVGILYLVLCYYCTQANLNFFAIVFFIFSLHSIIMAALVDHMTRIEKAQFKAWQKYISDKLKERKDKDS